MFSLMYVNIVEFKEVYYNYNVPSFVSMYRNLYFVILKSQTFFRNTVYH